jgi:hypothetical protein
MKHWIEINLNIISEKSNSQIIEKEKKTNENNIEKQIRPNHISRVIYAALDRLHEINQAASAGCHTHTHLLCKLCCMYVL